MQVKVKASQVQVSIWDVKLRTIVTEADVTAKLLKSWMLKKDGQP